MTLQNFRVHDLTPDDVARSIADNSVMLVDVREPNETAAERFPGAVNVPLSTFDVRAIPDPEG